MKTLIESNPSYALLTVDLEPGEKIKAEPGAMVSQQGVEMQTGGSGGVFRGIRRMMAGESFMVNTFTAGASGGQVNLAPCVPGDIGEFRLTPGRNLYIQASSFLACEDHVQTDSKFQGFRSLFSGESMFFLRAFAEERPGSVFYNSYGAIKEMQVMPGGELVVDTGHLVAFTEDVEYTIGKVGGLRSLVLGGEGLVLKFRGSGQVWIQSRNLASLAEKLAPFLSTRK